MVLSSDLSCFLTRIETNTIPSLQSYTILPISEKQWATTCTSQECDHEGIQLQYRSLLSFCEKLFRLGSVDAIFAYSLVTDNRNMSHDRDMDI